MSRTRSWWQPRRSRRSQRWAALIIVFGLVTGVVSGLWLYQRVVAFPMQAMLGSSEPIAIEIPRGASFPQVLQLLVKHGVIPEEQATIFRLFVLHRGAARKTTAGPHEFRGNMTPVEILEELARAQRRAEVSVTIPEGKHLLEVAAILEARGLGSAEAFETAMRDPVVLERLGIEGETIEGYLFPDTYRFAVGATPEAVLSRMVERHQQVYETLARRHRDALEQLNKSLGWGHREVVILASIVEKETGAAHERPLIAGVFLNRLRNPRFKPKLLQTDPTIIYGCVVPETKSSACEQFEGRIRRIHLQDQDNPYSTYAHEGLPPGPISNPGEAALKAVLAPKTSKFLYFVHRNDGTHQFSRTVAEHEFWVEHYMRQGAKGPPSKQDTRRMKQALGR